jgi:uroporphyrinogen-III synthase
MRVWVTRPAAEADSWVQQLRGRGFDALALPLIEIRRAPSTEPLEAAWHGLPARRAVMFVSANAVRGFFAAAPNGARWPAGTRAWSTGEGTRQALQDAGVPAASIDSPSVDAVQFDSEALWERVAGQADADASVLIVRGADSGDADAGAGRDWLAAQLRAAGSDVERVVAYVRACPEWDAAQRSDALADAVGSVWLFSSSQALAHLRVLVPAQTWASARAVATHPRIAQAARDAGFGVVCESRPTVDAVVAVLESFQ